MLLIGLYGGFAFVCGRRLVVGFWIQRCWTCFVLLIFPAWVWGCCLGLSSTCELGFCGFCFGGVGVDCSRLFCG